MSDHAAASTHAPGHHAGDSPESGAPAAPFTREEITQFDHDDTLAGKAIGKLLAVIFLYTVVVMSLAAWWTFGRQ